MEIIPLSSNLVSYIYENEHIVYNKSTGCAYHIGQAEFDLLMKSNGELDLMCHKAADTSDGFSYEQIHALNKLFGLQKRKFPRLCSWNKLQIPIIDLSDKVTSNRWLAGIYQFIDMFALWSFLIAIILCFDKLTAISWNFKALFQDPMHIFLLFVSIFPSTLIHEFMHIMAAEKNGAKATEAGFMLYWFIPCAYAKICAVRWVSDPERRIDIFLAGIKANALLTALLLLFPKQILVSYFWVPLVVNLSSMLACLSIFLKSDGYYAMEILLNAENLHQESMFFLKRILRKKAKDIEKENIPVYVCYCAIAFLSLISFVVVMVFALW